MANAEDYAAWIVKNADKKGTPEFDTVAKAYQAARATPQDQAPSAPGGLSEADRATLLAAKPLDRGGRNDYGALGAARDVVAGGVRGAGSIGATMIGPIDWAMDKMEGRGGHTLSSLITGVKPLTRNEQRRANMDAGLSNLLGADPESISYKVGKIGAEVAGTAGVGGTLASGVQAIPTIARYAPNVATALRTGGIGRQSGNMLTRVAAGAVTGGASAGLVDPDNALFGAGIGAVLPVAGAALGRAAGVVRGPEQPKELASAVTKARESGYVIPPTQAKGSIVNRLMEGLSGKISTAQNASALNQKVTDRLAKSAIGAADDAPLTPEVLDNIREEAGRAYGAISKLGKLESAGSDLPKSVGVKKFTDPLTLGQRIEVDAGEVIRAWKQANHDATAYFRAYARDANPETLAKAKSAASDAGKIDKFLEGSLSKLGMDDMVSALKDARVRIAKTYSVENALDATTGTIDARKLAAAMQKGKPLSGELKSIAEFAGRFPKAAQRPEAMGSLPQLSPLDWAAGGAMSAASANPLYLAATFARPGARKAALSPIVQNRLIQGPQNQLVRSAFTGAGRAAPVTAAELRSSRQDEPMATPAAAGYGTRADGSHKGRGFLGELRRPDGDISTEISVGVNIDGRETEIPTLVPTLTRGEIDYLLSGGRPTDSIVDKAVKHARERIAKGKSPFADEAESPRSGGIFK